MRVLASLFLLLTACTTTPPRTSADALSRFDELLPFLPDDMQSYWFSDGRGSLELNRIGPDVLQAVAAGDFEAPTDIGFGAHRFVKVQLRAPGAAPPCIDDWNGEYGERAVAEPIGARPVWRVTQPRHQPEWVAFVDDRFTLIASSQQLLELALQRPGSRAGVLHAMPSLAALAADAREVMLLRPRPQPDQAPHFQPGMLCGGPSPQVPMLAQAWIGVDGFYERLQLLASDPQQLADFVGPWRAFTNLPASAMREQQGLHVVEFEMQDGPGLFLWLLFGLHVFV